MGVGAAYEPSLSTVGGNLPVMTTPPATTTQREEADAGDQDTHEEPRRMSRAVEQLEAPAHTELVALRQRVDEQKRELEESHQQINRLQREVQGLRDQLEGSQAAARAQAAAGADCESERQERSREQRPPQKAAIPDMKFISDEAEAAREGGSPTPSYRHMASAVIPESRQAIFICNEAKAALECGSPIPSIRASTRKFRAGSDEFTAEPPRCSTRSRVPQHMRPTAGRVHTTSSHAHDDTRSSSAEARL